ncbi:MAG TPA: hypothetical protein VFX76_01905, partial [Roseiflexaceae bacterium]|nr:hypothetical protein [Roseiflexaceae bacterium]
MVGAIALCCANLVLADDVDMLRPIADIRLRYEAVEQVPQVADADAVTLRSRLGVETAKVWGTTLLAEGEFVWPLLDHYNSTVNGHTRYPVVADP